MTNRHAICLVVDGLRASALGAYGNTHFPTPQLDSLASRSLVSEWLIADSPTLDGFYRSVWERKHAMRFQSKDQVVGCSGSIIDQLKQAKVRQSLVSDEPWVADQADSCLFDESLFVEFPGEKTASELEATSLAHFFSEAIEYLHEWREEVSDNSSMLWLHSRGMFGPWDAPLAMREQLLDEDDPPPADFNEPPHQLSGIDDPDTLLSYRVAYAAQVIVLDACVGALIESLESLFAGSDTLVMLIGSRGMALGEHGTIGTNCAELYSERIHLPWMIYPCSNTNPLPRQTSLSQPADIGGTLLDWFGLKTADNLNCDGTSSLPLLSGGCYEPRRLAISTGEHGDSIIRTPAWLLKAKEAGGSASAELFTKPDDRWESNDISALCPEVVEQLAKELAECKQACRDGKSLPRSPQQDELCQPLR